MIGTLSGGREEILTAIGETVNVASRIESANREAGTRLSISEGLFRQVENPVEVSDFVRVRLRGTNERIIPCDSRLTDDLGLVCRFHESCFDLQTGEARTWAPALQGDGTSKAWEHMGDLSKNRAPIKPLPCVVKDGFLRVALR